MRPARGVVVRQSEDLFFRKRRAAEEGEGAGSIAGGGPAGAAVESHAFITHDADNATAAEGFRVGLAFDLQDVEGQQDNFTNADQRAGSGVEDRFTRAGAEG